jgi:RNA polymerase sigma-70 factor (ECF subfamily)
MRNARDGSDSFLPEITTTALLERLLETSNAEAWSELDRRYRPILLGFARRLGLSLEDAEDAAQEALVRVAKHYPSGGYDRRRGRLRSWIFGIARRCILDVHEARRKRCEQRGLSAIVELPGRDRFEQTWDEECRRAIRERALSQLRQETRFDERTIRAFERVVLEGQAPADVAKDLSLSVDSVYASKHRCTRALREIVSRLESIYEIG